MFFLLKLTMNWVEWKDFQRKSNKVKKGSEVTVGSHFQPLQFQWTSPLRVSRMYICLPCFLEFYDVFVSVLMMLKLIITNVLILLNTFFAVSLFITYMERQIYACTRAPNSPLYLSLQVCKSHSWLIEVSPSCILLLK